MDRLEQESLPRGAAHRAEEVDLVWSLTPKDADNGRVDVGTSAGREVQGPRQHEPVRHRQPPIEARKVVDEREVGRKHPEQILHRGLRPSTALGSLDEVILPQNRRTQLQLGRNPSHEQEVTASINNIYATAYGLKDFRTMQFLDWFIKEQNEEEKNTETIVKKYDLFGREAKGLYMLDNELATRVYAAPTLVI